MITSADVRDYIDGLIREVRETHKGNFFLEVSGRVYETLSDHPLINWTAWTDFTGHSPNFHTAEEAVRWFRDWRSESVGTIRSKAAALQAEAESLLAKAAELESQTTKTNEA